MQSGLTGQLDDRPVSGSNPIDRFAFKGIGSGTPLLASQRTLFSGLAGPSMMFTERGRVCQTLHDSGGTNALRGERMLSAAVGVL